MRNLIYQYWDGKITDACIASVNNLRNYANKIGAEHIFEENPNFIRKQGLNLGKYTPHYGAFKPAFDKTFYELYDNIMFADSDIFALDHIQDNIFEEFQNLNADISMCTEPLQPVLRTLVKSNIATSEMDEKWNTTIKQKYNVELPRTNTRLLKVYNSGVVLYSNKGLEDVRTKFKSFNEYMSMVKKAGLSTFYEGDQNYLHAMIFICNVKFKELDNEWNRYITWAGYKKPKTTICDSRTPDTKMVHIQMRGADSFNAKQLWTIANKPINEWGVGPDNKKFTKGDCITGEPL